MFFLTLNDIYRQSPLQRFFVFCTHVISNFTHDLVRLDGGASALKFAKFE